MKNTWIVLRTEFINTITRRSFLLTLILVPLIPALIMGIISLVGGDQAADSIGSIFQAPELTGQIEGFVDQANIITELPEWVREDALLEYSTEENARNAIASGEIARYYVIDPDFIESGEINYVLAEYSTFSALESTGLIESVVRYNLVGADMQRFETYSNPVLIEWIDLTPDEVNRDVSNPLAFYVPYGMTMLFYVLIFTSASLMMNSVAKEKENRIMEILISSVNPRQLLAGKIIGLGLVGLLQMIVWTGSTYFLLQLGGRTFELPQELLLRPEVLLWGVAFFVLGYLIYATIMAGVGAFVSNVKEATQATFYVILPILISLIFVSPIIERPNGTLPVVLSLIPLTAPTTIMTRISSGAVPLWQILLSIGLMISMFIFLIRGVAGMFRAQLLLTGQKFNLRKYIRAVISGASSSNRTE
jgi:ABC-2 type transport system permease protein